MAESMTGFGRASSSEGGIEATVEVRTVNGRFVEVGVRLPRELAAHEVDIQNRARAVLARGKVNVTVQVEWGEESSGMAVNEPLARAYADLMDRLRLVAGIREPIRLEHLLQQKDILVPEDASDRAAAAWKACSRSLDQALEACRDMRRREGAALAGDLGERLEAIERGLGEVEKAAPARIEPARERLQRRIAELLDGEAGIDRERLEMEVAILVDRLDVSEECVRLRSHLEQCRHALAGADQPGRRLNFLAQEMNREINTIAAKANDAAIAHLAVAMKEELEKVREQVQNLA